MYRGWYVSWRLSLFLPHVRFHYDLCSRVDENLIELTLFFPLFVLILLEYRWAHTFR